MADLHKVVDLLREAVLLRVVVHRKEAVLLREVAPPAGPGPANVNLPGPRPA